MSLLRRIVKVVNRKVCIYFIAVFLPLALLPLALSPYKESRCAFVMLLMAGYWLFEPVPIAATALLPIVLFPVVGIMGSGETCLNYMRESFMMFIGGLLMAIAVEDCRLHERIAMKVLLFVGTDLKWLMLGFMLTTMFLSMWVSNTATTAMMVPIVEVIVRRICSNSKGCDIALQDTDSMTESRVVEPEEVENAKFNKGSSAIKTALLLSVCYAANIGGTGTLTGTGPNLVLKGLLEELHPGSDEITFATWMLYNVPGMVTCVLIGWCYLWLVYVKCSKRELNLESEETIREIILTRYNNLGSMSSRESYVVVLFLSLVCLWVFRDPKFIQGWSELIGSGVQIGDSAPAIFIGFLLFLLPSDFRDFTSRPILDWKTVQLKLPWGVIILVGGGFALADAAQKSGLSEYIGNQLSAFAVLPLGSSVAILCFMTAMITEITTNTTTATILLPVINQMAISMGVNPLRLMLPVATVCSYAFMLPVATPPNAIAFASGNMRTLDMAKPGLVMNLVCCGVQLFMINTLGVAMFDLNTFPTWARSNKTLPH